MKKNFIIFLFTMTLLGCSAASYAHQPNLVGKLNNGSVADGCGCYFSFTKADQKKGSFMFFDGFAKFAWMNIDGRDVRLQQVRASGSKGNPRVGNRSTTRYMFGDITVDVVEVVTKACPPRSENCETTYYSATFTVRKGGRIQIVKAVGICGC